MLALTKLQIHHSFTVSILVIQKDMLEDEVINDSLYYQGWYMHFKKTKRARDCPILEDESMAFQNKNDKSNEE